MLDFDRVAGFRRETDLRSYSTRDSCLYGLSVSPPFQPGDEMALDLVLETRGPKILPTMASVLAESLSRFLGLDMRGVTHAQQQLICHRPLPPQGELVIDGHVTAVIDKGADRGALVTFENVATLKGETTPLFTLSNTLFARRDGGFGQSFGTPVPRHLVPERASDLFDRSQTRTDQALIFRLNGDLNPLHAEPAFAAKSGFAQPILHGLCTYGMACRAIVRAVLGGDPSRIHRFDVRFTAPLYPGETLQTEIWVDGDEISFRCTAVERAVVVLDGGYCLLAQGLFV